MAVGLVVFGEDEVSATSDLGVAVRDAAIEPRREDILFDAWGGERVHVATGSEIRTYDLRARASSSRSWRHPGPRRSRSTAATACSSSGRTTGGSRPSSSTSSASAGWTPAWSRAPLAELDHPIEHLLVSADGGTVLAASGDRLTAVDVATGTVRGVVDLPGIADLVAGRDRRVARRDAVGDGRSGGRGDDPRRSPRRRPRTRIWRSSPGPRTPTPRSSSARPGPERRGPRSTRPSPTGAWPASRSWTCPASPSLRTPASPSSIRPRPACRRPSGWWAGRTASPT